MVKEDIEQTLKEYEDKLYSPNVGLTSNDYYSLKKLLKLIDNNKEFVQYEIRIKNLLNLLSDSCVIYKFTKENCQYVLDKLSVLPFVYANGEYFKYSCQKRNQFKFYYKLDDKIAVIEVDDTVIKVTTLGMETTEVRHLTNVEYLMETECISYDEALEVLLGTYNCKYDNADRNLKPIIKKYQDVLKSGRFLKFLQEACNTAKIDEQLDNKVLGYYAKMIDACSRLTNNKENTDFRYVKPPKKLVLEKK